MVETMISSEDTRVEYDYVRAVLSISHIILYSVFVFFFFSSRRRHTRSVSAFLLNRSSDLVKILIFAAEGLTKRSAVGFLLRSLIMFQTFISRHNSNFFSDKLVLTSVKIGRASCRERV